MILSKQEYGLNEKVTMVCDSNSTYGNLTCGRSIWKKDGQLKIIEYDNKMEFLMQRSAAGNYTCQCLNNCEKKYEFSDAIEIIFIETGKPETLRLLSIKWNLLRLGCRADGIVPKIVHKTLPGPLF